MLPWKHDNMIKHAIETAASEIKDILLTCCNKYGYWLGSLVLLKSLSRNLDVLTMIMQLEDYSLLDGETPQGECSINRNILWGNTARWVFYK